MATLLKPIPFTRFGGLVLNRPQDEVGADFAIDTLDVDWDDSLGMVRSRPGAKAFTGAAASNYDAIFAHSNLRLLARRGSTLHAVNDEGKEIEGKTAEVNEKHLSFARLGTPSAAYTFIADQQNTLKRYDGTDFTSPTCTVGEVSEADMPKGRFLSVWPDGGNRLVIAGTVASGGPNGAISSPSHVWFSEPGDPESYESTAFVQLHPGDGEEIIACVAWGGMVFVFKETKLFIFYGVSADSEGKPVFNFRTVELGTRMRAPQAHTGEQAVAGTDSVYFVANHGVYATTGGDPSMLSLDLEPLGRSETLVGPISTTLGERRFTHASGVAYMDEALYVGLDNEGTVDRVLKYDLRKDAWTIYGAALNCMAPWVEQTLERGRVFFSGAAATEAGRKIYRYTPASDEDPTVEMEPRWRSGIYDVELADEKTFVRAKVWGTGSPELKVSEDYGSLGSAVAFSLGEGSAIAQQQRQLSQSATLFSHEISGTAPWSVQRIHRYMRGTRPPATQEP